MKTASQNSIIENFCDSLWMEKGLAKNTLDAYASDLIQVIAFMNKGFFIFVLPAIEKMLNKNIKNPLFINAITKSTINKKRGRMEYQRAKLVKLKNKYFVETTGMQGSNILTSLAMANCYIRLPANTSKIKKGDNVEVLPFSNKF